MKKHLLPLLAFVLLAWQTGAQQVTRSDWQSLQLSFDVAQPTFGATTLFGSEFSTLELAGYMTCNRSGEPDLPVMARMLEVPLCEGFTVELSDIVADTIDGPNLPVVPCQPSRSKSDRSEPSLVMDSRVYARDAFLGEEFCRVERVGVARSVNLAQLYFAPVRYNPVRNQLIVVRHATVTITYQQPNVAATQKMKEMYSCEAFAPGVSVLNTLPGNKDLASSRTAPIHYLIVAHSSFRGQLDSFIAWKRRKGFIVTVGYTDEPTVGTTSTSIANYVKSFYTNATTSLPAPAYLLLVGDNEQIPAHNGQYGYSGPSAGQQITDLYYTTWTTGDLIPDCYCGRFSAQNASQLTPQIEKTLMYEQYTFANPAFLDKAILIAGVDGGTVGDNGYTYGDPAMDYAAKYYVTSDRFSTIYYYKNNTSFAPTGVTVTGASGSNAAAIRNLYNAGAGWINYTAHGSETSWGNPQMTVTQVGQMTNSQKFGFMIGNCCLTGSFQVGECFGEALLRKGNYCGAVEYFGGSNSTYWVQDFYWSVGIRSNISNTMDATYDAQHLGMYDCLFHTHNEARSNWGITAGGMMMSGTMAVQNSTASGKQYYWEIYHNFGDPSVMPWLGQAQLMTVQAANAVPIGTTTLSVNAVPYAYCALTDGQGALIAATYADASGNATLNIASLSAPGTYELAVSAQHYRTFFQNVNVFVSSGPYVTASHFSATLNAGQAVQFAATIKNVGTAATGSLQAQLVVDGNVVTLSNSQRSLSNLASGDSLVISNLFTGNVAAAIADQTLTNVTLRLVWGSGTNQQSERTYSLPVNAPYMQVTGTTLTGNAQAGNTVTLAFADKNAGHLAASGLTCSLTSSSPYLTVGNGGTSSLGTLQPNASATAQYTVHIDASAPAGFYTLHHIIQNGSLYVDHEYRLAVGRVTESFESNQFAVNGWAQGTLPWTIVSNGAYAGTYCARSATTITHSQSSDLSITWACATDDSISFFYKVSSEANYDKFIFYIDDVARLEASGTTAVWTRASFPVNAGNHTFRFSYSKDASVSSGSDCAWIDNIAFPIELTCDPIAMLPWSEDFNSTTATAHNAAGDLPGCWDGYSNGTSSGYAPHVVTPGSYSYISTSSPGLLLISGSASYGDTKLVRLPSFSTPLNELELTFYYRHESASSGTLTVGYFTGDDLSATFVPVQTMPASTTGTTATVSLANVPSTARYIGFKWYHTSSYYGCFIDDVSVDAPVPPTPVYTVSVSAGEGGTASGGGTYEQGTIVTLTATPDACHAFLQWSDGSTQNPLTFACTADVDLTAQFLLLAFSGEESAEACDSYTWHDSTYTLGGDYTYAATTAAGCDSTATLHLTLHYSVASELSASDTESYTWHEVTYTESGDYTWQGLTLYGCDSTETLHLTIYPPDTIPSTPDTIPSTPDTTGILSPEPVAVSLYPNPTLGDVVVECPQAPIDWVAVYDVQGRILRREKPQAHRFRLSTSGLVPGTYLVRIYAGGHGSVMKLTKR